MSEVTFAAELQPPQKPARRLAPQTEESIAPSPLGICHGYGGCPGFTGHGAQQDIKPRTFWQLLIEDCAAVEIPLFQRKYCWGAAQGDKWLADLLLPVKRNGWNNCHNTGKAIFKKVSQNGADRAAFICVDGQQRLTTTMLLMIALRDAALRCDLKSPETSALVDDIESVLYQSSDRTSCSACNRLPRLTPSLADRATFLSHLHGAAGLLDGPLSDRNPYLDRMKAFFDESVGALVREHGAQYLRHVWHQSLHSMYLVSVEILNEVDLTQVFMWLQEKSLLGMSSLLENLAPGVEFRAGDLIRNLLLAPYMKAFGLGSPELENAYCSKWLLAVEKRAATLDELDTLLEAALCKWYCVGSEGRDNDTNWRACRSAVSGFEQRIMQMVEFFSAKGVLKYNTRGIELYAAFITFVDAFAAATPHTSPLDLADSILAFLAASVHRRSPAASVSL